MRNKLEWDDDVTTCRRYALSKGLVRYGPNSYVEWFVLKSKNFPAGDAPYESIGVCGRKRHAKKLAQDDLNNELSSGPRSPHIFGGS